MRILILNWRDARNPDAGGFELLLQEIGSRWAKSGHEVSFFSSSFAGAPSNETIDGVNVHRRGNRYTVYPATISRLLTDRSDNYDVIFESINTIPFFAPLFSRIPVVGEIYSIENKSVLIQEMSLGMMPAAGAAYLLSSTIPSVYKKCEITTISNFAKDALVEEGFDSNKVHVASPGLSNSWIEIAKTREWIERPNNSIVYLGRLKKYKGVQDILHAIPLIRRRIPDIKLSIIGKGDYEPILRRMVESLGIQQNVDFSGFVSEREKARMLNEASLYVCTSRDEGGWTITAIEAMSMGVPVLVTKSQIDVINGGFTGRLLKNEEPSEIAQNAVTLLEDRILWPNSQRMPLNSARSSVGQYCIDYNGSSKEGFKVSRN